MAECRLTLILPSILSPGLVRDLRDVLAVGDIACVVAPARDFAAEDPSILTSLLDLCHDHDVAFTLESDPEHASSLGADGVHISLESEDDIEGYRAARAILGNNGIVGVYCGLSRHAAMIAGEAGADYVAFGTSGPLSEDRDENVTSLVSWWRDLFQPPCVAWDVSDSETLQAASAAGADFVAAGDCIWRHPDGPEAGVRAILKLLV